MVAEVDDVLTVVAEVLEVDDVVFVTLDDDVDSVVADVLDVDVVTEVVVLNSPKPFSQP